jgi:hypothetical protein
LRAPILYRLKYLALARVAACVKEATTKTLIEVCLRRGFKSFTAEEELQLKNSNKWSWEKPDEDLHDDDDQCAAAQAAESGGGSSGTDGAASEA